MAAVFQNHASFADARHQNQCGHKHYWLTVSFRYHHGTDTGRTGYSTESLSIYIMRMCYGSRTGYSTAVAMILFFIILIPVLISMRLTREKD